MRTPDFDNILMVLKKQRPSRPTLFEYFMNETIYKHLTGGQSYTEKFEYRKMLVRAYAEAGYDYVLIPTDFGFPKGRVEHIKTKSLNDGVSFATREEFERYDWPDPDKSDYGTFERIAPHLPGNMKAMFAGPCGVLENVIALAGYDNLCFMLFEQPDLARDIFDAVGSRLLRHYEIGMAFDTVGILMANDDWGFNTQTFLSPAHMREYVFPWYKKIVDCAHRHGKPAVLHSCGNLAQIMDDIIDDIKFDGKHSYEDVICPVEDMYEKYCGRIAILGGIDVDFICTHTPEDVYARSKAMLERADSRGGYALGTGNSVPEYVPMAGYFAMISAATGKKYM